MPKVVRSNPGFESEHRIPDGQFFTFIFIVKFVMFVRKDENK